MLILGAAVCGFLLDLLLGDQVDAHPVVLMGKIISRAEGTLRRRFPPPGGEIAAGTILAALLPLGTLAFCGGVCFLALCIHPALCFAVQTLWCWQALAMRGLLQESAAVQRQLERENLPAARAAVGRIVGRDTDRLTAEGVIRAAVETVAENFCDGVAAPLLYMFLGGAPLALAYKAVNTMDSIVGYKNERYLYFGRRAARLDDAASHLPARTAALPDSRGGPYRPECRRSLPDLAAGQALPRQSQFSADGVRLCRGFGNPVGGTCLVFRAAV